MMVETPVIATERFIMRPIEPNDCAALFPTLSDERQCRYLTRPAFKSEQELAGWLFEPGWNGRTWIAQEKSGGAVAARLVSVPAHEKGVEELGWITVCGRQGQGIASECAAALVGHLFASEGLRKLTAEVDADNAASIRLLEKLRFTQEAHLREHETTHIGLRDVLLYGLLTGEWEAARAANHC